jgi:hypothetical protein
MVENFTIFNVTDGFSIPINDDIIQKAFPILPHDILLIIGATPDEFHIHQFINTYPHNIIYTLDLTAARVPTERHLQVDLCNVSQYDRIPRHDFTKIIFDWAVLHHLIDNVKCSALFASLYEWLAEDGILFFYPLRISNLSIRHYSVNISIMMELLVKYFDVYKATMFNPEKNVIPLYPLEIIPPHMPEIPLDQQVELNKHNVMFRDYNIAIKKNRDAIVAITDLWKDLGRTKRKKRQKSRKSRKTYK